MGGPIWFILASIMGFFILWCVSIPLAHHHIIWWALPWLLGVCLAAFVALLIYLLVKTAEGL